MTFDRKIENLIANLRGLPEDPSRAFIRKAASLGSVLEGLEVKTAHQRRRYESVVQHWESLVGAPYAQRCSPARLLEGGSVLIVNVPNATLRQHMQFQKVDLLRRLQKLPYCKTIRNIVLHGA